jgi:hypothetical protein
VLTAFRSYSEQRTAVTEIAPGSPEQPPLGIDML